MARTKSLFDNALANGGPTMRWLESNDAATVEAFCRQALYADLLMLGQPDPCATLAGFVESVLIGTDKPAPILPFTGKLKMTSRDVLIDWNATPQAAGAVTPALPWLSSAHRVHVLEADDLAPHYPGKLDIAQYLQFHGIVPALHRHRASSADAGDALLSFASKVGADLRVMGGYGQSRAREPMLGGASRSVLKSMTLPVVMAH